MTGIFKKPYLNCNVEIQKLLHSFDNILFSMKNKSRALRPVPVCKQVVKSLAVVTGHVQVL